VYSESYGEAEDMAPTRAFVLIETAVGKTHDVVASLEKVGVDSVDVVTGPYDIIVVLKGTSLGEIGNLVTGQVHPIPGIIRTVTCLAVGND
jgi:DNA-binding Lrp family transcriptional regulator